MRRAKLHAHSLVYQQALRPRKGWGHNYVAGEGDVMSPLVFIGEAPGAEEDAQSRPFVGPSGALLDELLDAAGFEREFVYITNMVKYRPPNNADPDETTMLAAVGLMRMELDIIKPLLVVPLGRYASTLYWPDPSMQFIAGQRWTKSTEVHSQERVTVVPMYHPSWALRGGKDKRILMHTHMATVRATLDALTRVVP